MRNLRAPGCLCVHSYSRIYCCLSVTYHASQQFSFEHVRKYDSQKFYAGSCRYLSSSTFLGHLCSGNKCSRHWLIYQVRLVSTVLSVICIERIAMFSLLGGFSVYQNLASSPACAKKGRAPGTHYTLCMSLISPRCGDSELFSDSSVLCDVRVWTQYSILVRIL